MNKAQVQNATAAEFNYQGQRAIVRDLASHHSYLYIRSHGVGKPNKAHMRATVKMHVQADYKAFQAEPQAHFDKLLERTRLQARVKQGLISGILGSILVSLISRWVTNWIWREFA